MLRKNILFFLLIIIFLPIPAFSNTFESLKQNFYNALNNQNFSEAKQILLKIEPLCNSKEQKEKLNIFYADYYQISGNYSEALKYRTLVLPYLEKSGNNIELIKQYINLSVIYFNLGKKQDGLNMLLKAGKFIKQEKEKKTEDLNSLKRIYLINLATYYLKEKQYKKAYSIYLKALKFLEKNSKAYIQTNLNLAKCLLNLNREKEAEKIIENSIKYSIKFPKLHLYALMLKFDYLIHANQTKQAERTLREVIKKAEEKNYNFILKKSYRKLLKLAIKQKQTTKALKYLDKFEEAEKRVFNEQTAISLAKFNERIKAIKMENRIKELKYKSEIQKKTILLLLVSSLFILTLLFIIYRLFRKKAELSRKLEKLSKTDPLTKLLNRRAIEGVIEELKNKNEEMNYTVCICDIDFFKKINDTYGHKAGDKVLETVSDLIKNGLRKKDFVSRWGGEEFLLLFPHTEKNEAKKIIERLKNTIEKTQINYEDKKIKLTMSFGIASSNNLNEINKIIKNADTALYHSKKTGRNKISVYEEITQA